MIHRSFQRSPFPVNRWKAMRRPSGDHLGECAQSSYWVSGSTRPSSDTNTTRFFDVPPGFTRCRSVAASIFPSGRQSRSNSRCVSSVTGPAFDPSLFMSQTASSRVKAMSLPDGAGTGAAVVVVVPSVGRLGTASGLLLPPPPGPASGAGCPGSDGAAPGVVTSSGQAPTSAAGVIPTRVPGPSDDPMDSTKAPTTATETVTADRCSRRRRRSSSRVRARTRSRTTETGVATGQVSPGKGDPSFGVVELGAESGEPAAGMTLDAARRDAEHRGDLRLRQIDEITEGEDVALTTGEGAEQLAQGDRRVAVAWADALLERRGRGEPTSANDVDREIGGDPGHPRAGDRHASHPSPRVGGPGQRLGRHVFRLARMTDDAIGHVVRLSEQVLEDCFEIDRLRAWHVHRTNSRLVRLTDRP